MKIRPYTKKDSAHFLALLEEFLEYSKKSYGKVVLEFESYKESRKKVLAKEYMKHFVNLKDSRLLVAEENSEVVGYIIGNILDTKHRIKEKEGHLESFFVSAKVRGKGVGKKLYGALLSWFRKKKCDHLSLDVARGNKSAAIYKKWGFRPVRTSMKKMI
jgi:ribosomal protein S18 acetylase RimI-like enzyme